MLNKNHPEDLIRILYEIADDAEAPPSSRLTAIKEILDRTVGKGALLESDTQDTRPVEIVFRMLDAQSNT